MNAKLHEETITPEEHRELLQLVDRRELADAERLQHVIELARIRNVSVEAILMNRSELVNMRRLLYLIKQHPPKLNDT